MADIEKMVSIGFRKPGVEVELKIREGQVPLRNLKKPEDFPISGTDGFCRLSNRDIRGQGSG